MTRLTIAKTPKCYVGGKFIRSESGRVVPLETKRGEFLCNIPQCSRKDLRNAVEASRGLSESPEVFISLRRVTAGIELAVEDRGVGIEPSMLDEVFDPFFGDGREGIDEGFGLPICLRIVERHGGELRIEAEDRPGTRVSVLLPESPEAGE